MLIYIFSSALSFRNPRLVKQLSETICVLVSVLVSSNLRVYYLNVYSFVNVLSLWRTPEFHCGHVFPSSRDLQWAEARERQPLWTKWGLGEGDLTVGLQKCSQNHSSVSTLVPMRVKERCYLRTKARIASERLWSKIQMVFSFYTLKKASEML